MNPFQPTSLFQIALGSVLLFSTQVNAQGCGEFKCSEPLLGYDWLQPATMCNTATQRTLCMPVPFLFDLFGSYQCGPCTGQSGGESGTTGSGGTGGAAPTSGSAGTTFKISMQFEGVSNADSLVFKNAAETWAGLVTSGGMGVTLANSLRQSTDCKGTLPASVNGIHICSLFEDIDGVSGVLGYAGPRVIDVDDTNGATRSITGDMVFDISDINQLRARGRLPNVITHEMGHVLGLGTLWTDNALDGSGCSYSGGNTAVAREWEKYTGCTDYDLKKLVEQTGGQGTSCSHWSEACLGDEMMTGYLSGTTQPLSPITLAALEDLGYSVDYSKADPFSPSDISFNCRCYNRQLRGGNNEPIAASDGGPPTNRRRLSSEGHEIATQYGKSLLRMRRAMMIAEGLEGGIGLHSLDDLGMQRDMGDKIVLVLFEENDNIYSVDVYA